MNIEINLLSRKRGSAFRNEKILAQLRVTAILSLIVVVVCSVGMFFVNQANSPAALSVQQQTLTTNLSASKDKIASQLQLVDRLTHIQTILTKRASLENNIQLFRKQLPSSVTVTTFALDDKTVSILLYAKDLNTIHTVITNMTNLVKSKKILKTLTVENVVADEKTSRYIISMDGTL